MPQARTSKKAPRATPKSNGNGTPVIEVPWDPTGDADTAETVANLLLNAYRERKSVFVLMKTNGHDMDDVAPGAGNKVTEDGTMVIEDGKPVLLTYRDLMADKQTLIDKIESTWDHIMPIVRRMLDERKARMSETAS